MKHLALTLTTALLTLSSPTHAQVDAEGSLARARGLFTRVDTDADGLVSAAEAGRNRIPSKDFVAYDADRDRKLSVSEFTLFYRQLLVKAGKSVGADLEAESARIEAGRRAKRAQDAERAEAARQEALKEAQRAAEARKEKQAADATRAKQAREARQRADAERKDSVGVEAQPDQGAAPPIVAPQEGLTDAQRAAEARAAKEAADQARARREREAQNAAQIEQERLSKLREEAARAEKARLEKQRLDALRAEEARQAKLAQDAERRKTAREEARPTGRGADGATTPAERRAAGYVKRLVDGGRLTAPQARDFHTVLSAPAAGSAGAVAPEALRTALSTAKKRISALVVSGGLSSEEGRQLSAALDARAQAALPAQEEDGPAARRRRGQGAGPKKAPGTRRVGEVKDAGSVRPLPRRDG